MASLSVPPVLTSPRQDAAALHKAFKGVLHVLFKVQT